MLGLKSPGLLARAAPDPPPEGRALPSVPDSTIRASFEGRQKRRSLHPSPTDAPLKRFNAIA